MDFDTISRWVAPVALIMSVANTAWAFLTKDVRAAAAKAGQNETKLTSHDRRIQEVESELKHMPTKDEVHRLQLGITELQGGLRTVDKHLDGLARAVDRIDNYLREEKGPTA